MRRLHKLSFNAIREVWLDSDGARGGRSGMIHVVLFQPEIAPNTGNIGRMCALTGSRLHLIHPLGFVINDRNLRRAGMDYWKALDVHENENWKAFRASALAPRRPYLNSVNARSGLRAGS